MDRIIMGQDAIGNGAAAQSDWWFFHQQFASLPRYQQIAFRQLASDAFVRHGGLLSDAAVGRWAHTPTANDYGTYIG